MMVINIVPRLRLLIFPIDPDLFAPFDVKNQECIVCQSLFLDSRIICLFICRFQSMHSFIMASELKRGILLKRLCEKHEVEELTYLLGRT